MEFKEYQHLERLGTTEVENIELGKCFVFPKIDGTNASVWMGDDGTIQAGSRKRHLSIEEDNHGFCAWAKSDIAILSYLTANPKHRLFGEWLVPHSLKTYRQTAWRQFYVFDVAIDREDGTMQYLDFDAYYKLLSEHGVNSIPPICIITNGDYSTFVEQMAKNVFLIEDGKGAGEGIVIKRYDFVNRYGRTTWAKIVTSEFKEAHVREMGASVINAKKLVEEDIAVEFVTQALVEKEYAKIASEDGWSSRMIPRLLNVVYYSIVKEDCWEFVKKHKNPSIDFKRLQHFVFAQVKKAKPELF